MLRPLLALPAAGAAVLFLTDTLDWLNLWHADDAGVAAESRPENEPNHLFPHL